MPVLLVGTVCLFHIHFYTFAIFNLQILFKLLNFEVSFYYLSDVLPLLKLYFIIYIFSVFLFLLIRFFVDVDGFRRKGTVLA